MRSLLLVTLFLLLSEINGKTLSPGCNYAATSVHFYPIGACETDKIITDTDTIYSAFKYVCYGNNEVYKLEYDSIDYCDGQIIRKTKVTSDLESFECDSSSLCGYSLGCSIRGCVTNINETDDCSECELNPNNYNKHCLPIITDHCIGNVGELLKKDTCSNSLLTEGLYHGQDCRDDAFIFDIESGGSDPSTNCFDNAYYITSCNTELLKPNCNYAATDLHFYPIGGCDKTKKVTGINIEYYSFEYVCDSEGDIYRKEYNTKDYCDGYPINSIKQNDILTSFECDLTDCEYADGCSKTGCVENDDCSSCEFGERNKNKNEYNQHCLPVVTGQCIGHKGELLVDAVCDDYTNLLTENFYFGEDECNTPIFNDQSGSNDKNINCKNNAFTTVECTPKNKKTAVHKGGNKDGNKGNSKVASDIVIDNNHNDNLLDDDNIDNLVDNNNDNLMDDDNIDNLVDDNNNENLMENDNNDNLVNNDNFMNDNNDNDNLMDDDKNDNLINDFNQFDNNKYNNDEHEYDNNNNNDNGSYIISYILYGTIILLSICCLYTCFKNKLYGNGYYGIKGNDIYRHNEESRSLF